ncbi:MAG: ferritin-like domain-containing protein [Candidatus Bathyarchaeia archaeon]|nr:ferritin-like domain-containing protein [Candidatus Bathyarchaeota archaeon]
MDPENKLLEFIREQIKIEKEIVDSINKSVESITNVAIRETLRGISFDSMKHSEMYSAALGLLTKTMPAITQEQLDEQRELVEKHIRIEANLIRRINEVLPSIGDEKVKLLLNAILEDERRHHEILKRILEVLVKGETITEEDWWDVIWRNVPFHGAPGG